MSPPWRSFFRESVFISTPVFKLPERQSSSLSPLFCFQLEHLQEMERPALHLKTKRYAKIEQTFRFWNWHIKGRTLPTKINCHTNVSWSWQFGWSWVPTKKKRNIKLFVLESLRRAKIIILWPHQFNSWAAGDVFFIVALKCHYDQILDIHFFIFSDTIGLF